MTNFEVLKNFVFKIINTQVIKNSFLNIIKYHHSHHYRPNPFVLAYNYLSKKFDSST